MCNNGQEESWKMGSAELVPLPCSKSCSESTDGREKESQSPISALKSSWRMSRLIWALRDPRDEGHFEQLCLLCVSTVQSCEMHTWFK